MIDQISKYSFSLDLMKYIAGLKRVELSLFLKASEFQQFDQTSFETTAASSLFKHQRSVLSVFSSTDPGELDQHCPIKTFQCVLSLSGSHSPHSS